MPAGLKKAAGLKKKSGLEAMAPAHSALLRQKKLAGHDLTGGKSTITKDMRGIKKAGAAEQGGIVHEEGHIVDQEDVSGRRPSEVQAEPHRDPPSSGVCSGGRIRGSDDRIPTAASREPGAPGRPTAGGVPVALTSNGEAAGSTDVGLTYRPGPRSARAFRARPRRAARTCCSPTSGWKPCSTSTMPSIC